MLLYVVGDFFLSYSFLTKDFMDENAESQDLIVAYVAHVTCMS